MDVAIKIKEIHSDILEENNIGLIGVDRKKSKILIKATKNQKIKSYIKFITLMQYAEN